MSGFLISQSQGLQILAIAEMLRSGELCFSLSCDDGKVAYEALIDVSQEIALQINNEENDMDDISGKISGARAADISYRDQAQATQRVRERETVSGAGTLRAEKPATSVGPLEAITQSILAQVRSLNEIAAKLNNHADMVHGGMPEAERSPRGSEDMPDTALRRIFYALGCLDDAMAANMEAAARNCTLA